MLIGIIMNEINDEHSDAYLDRTLDTELIEDISIFKFNLCTRVLLLVNEIYLLIHCLLCRYVYKTKDLYQRLDG